MNRDELRSHYRARIQRARGEGDNGNVEIAASRPLAAPRNDTRRGCASCGSPWITKLVLNPTSACNLACVYCFAAERAALTMTPETVSKALKLFGPNRVDVSWFGGEPLIAWGLIERTASAVADAQRRDCRVAADAAPRNDGKPKWHVTTNGTLITAEIAAGLKRLGFSVLLSLDGPERLHNAARPMRSGAGSFDAAMEGLERLNGAGIRPYCRATYLDEPALVERLEFFDGLFQERRIGGVSIEPAVLGEGCHVVTRATPHPPLSGGREEWAAAAEWYVDRARRAAAGGPKLLDFFFFRKMVERVRSSRKYNSECGAGKGYITVGADGTIYACHREEGTRIGHVDTGYDAAAHRLWADNRSDGNADCALCEANGICGGGCRQNRIALTGEIRGATPSVCAVKREVIRQARWLAKELPGGELTARLPRRASGAPRNDRHSDGSDQSDGSDRADTSDRSNGKRRSASAV